MQLPQEMVLRPLGEVNVFRTGASLKVEFTVLLPPRGEGLMGWQTGVALDASRSMQAAYGRTLAGNLPPEVASRYAKKGWVEYRIVGGRPSVLYKSKEAMLDALNNGHDHYTANSVQKPAREFIAYLARELDADGGTTVIYWACGDGADVEVAGDFTHEECLGLEVRGPKSLPFGKRTVLKPAVRYFVERFRDARRGMYLFITDGRLHDLEDVKRYTVQLAREVEAGRRNKFKCVLIGVGDDIDERQMEELDDLPDAAGLEEDIWDHKVVKGMRDVLDIFAEPLDPEAVVAENAAIYDAAGRELTFCDAKGKPVRGSPKRLTAKASFVMPASSAWFELVVDGERIRQPVAAPGR